MLFRRKLKIAHIATSAFTIKGEAMRTTLRFEKKGAVLVLALGLAACGGGGGDSSCTSGISGLCNTLGVNLSPTTSGPVKDATGSTTAGGSTIATPGTQALTMLTSTITTSDCTTNIPFIFSGGVGPYTVLTSDLTLVPVSAPLPLGSKWYFLASIRSLYDSPDRVDALGRHWELPRKATVTVLDSAAQSAATKIDIASVHECGTNPLLQINPASTNAHITEIIRFSVTGGKLPFTVTSSDPGVVTVLAGDLPGAEFDAQATASSRTTSEAALLTVTSADGQKASITFTVLPR